MGTAEIVEADYCVFGAGPAGLSLAESLAKDGSRVALVEQGLRYSDADRGKLIELRQQRLSGRELDFDQSGAGDHVQPNPTGEYYYSRLSAVGGTSLHWDGHTPRPKESDMRTRQLFGYGRDWPISYQELEPWLVKAEQRMGVSGADDNPYASARSAPFPMPPLPTSHFEREYLVPGLKKLGMVAHSRANAINSQPYQGRSQCIGCRACTVCPSGARYAADRVHLPSFLASKNARLFSGTRLARIEVSKTGDAVHECFGQSLDGKEYVFRARKFVLALGGVETPRMLLLSKSTAHPAGLGNAGGQVGVGFSDHPMTFFFQLLAKNLGHALMFPSMNSEHFRQDESRDQCGTFSLNIFPDRYWTAATTAPLIKRATFKQTLSLELLRELAGRVVVGYSINEHTGPGTLRLDPDKKDAFGNPVAHVDIELGEREREAMKKRVEVAARLGEVLGAESDFADDPVDRFFWGAHPSGGTAMGTAADNGVCDDNLRVMGLSNLHVVSSSVFPQTGAFNPTLTIVALALRLADHLRGQR